MATKTFKLVRDTYRGGTTLGKLFDPNGNMVCHTLEDIVRGWGIKDGGTTAIPTGRYKLTVSMSNKFKRRMVMVYTEANKYEIILNGIGFKGVRMHGGNTNKDTWGCIIVASKRLNDQTVQGSQEANVTDLVDAYIKQGHSVELEVVNGRQTL